MQKTHTEQNNKILNKGRVSIQTHSAHSGQIYKPSLLLSGNPI